MLDLAVAVALGGDCAADIAVVRAQPEVFGLVASDPTVSRLIDRLATDADRALAAIRAARATARARVWQHTGTPRQAGVVTLDLDATLVTAHFGEGTGRQNVEEGLRVPPAAGVRRPR